MALRFLKRLVGTIIGSRIPVRRMDPEARSRAAEYGLERLNDLHGRRFKRFREIVDLLPPSDVDLAEVRKRAVPEDAIADPSLSRRDMADHLQSLRAQFAGRSELLVLHALCISYLRRGTPLTAKARHLFHRLWAEQGEFLARELSARWLVSALQTFHDHGIGEGERRAGGIGFVYGNLVKIYETERDDATARTPMGGGNPHVNETVPGLGGFMVGGDILLNINLLVYDAALRGGLARRPLLALMREVKESGAIFARIDAIEPGLPIRRQDNFVFAFDGKDDDV